MRRGRMSKSHSRSNFRKGAQSVHRKNLVGSSGSAMVMRGGIRL